MHVLSAAESASARAQTAHDFCCVTHTDLTHFDAAFKLVGKAFDKLAEVNSAVCREVKYSL